MAWQDRALIITSLVGLSFFTVRDMSKAENQVPFVIFGLFVLIFSGYRLIEEHYTPEVVPVDLFMIPENRRLVRLDRGSHD